jgi:hypothetical protein
MINRNKRQVLKVAGSILIVAGALLLGLGLFGFLIYAPACPVNACPSIFSGYYAFQWDEIYAGFAMIGLGVAMMVASAKL